MSIFEIILLGLLQGLTEFIPISSSGHLIIAHELFGTVQNSLVFDVALHVGTLFALAVFFRRDILNLLTNVFKANKSGRLARLLIMATIPAAAAGFLFEDLIDQHMRRIEVVAVTLAVVAVIMFLAERTAKNRQESEISTANAAVIGLAQAVALVPGVSRSGATITAGIFCGLNRVSAARFSFLLAMPIITGSALGVFLQNGDVVSGNASDLVLGAATAFVSGLLAIKFLMNYLAKHSLAVFAWYRLGLAAVVLAVVIIK